MNSNKLSLVLSLALLVVTIFFVRERMLRNESSPSEEEASNPVAEEFHAVLEEAWETTMRTSPTWASSLGDRRWNDQWPDLSFEAMAASEQESQRLLGKLSNIDRAQLSPLDQINYDLFKKGNEVSSEEFGHHWYLIPLNQRGGIQTGDDLGDSLRFSTVKDYEDWIARLECFGAYAQQTQALMQKGIEEKMLLPKIIMQRIPAQIEKQIVDDPADSPFYRPLKALDNADIEEADRKRLRATAQKAIREQVIPFYRSFKTFFETSYLPACPEAVGIWNLPNGQNLYAFFARKFTTTDLTPDEIHDIGLSEVARIRKEMEVVKNQVGFQGDLQAFFEYLRTDPQFFFETEEELMAGYRAISKRIDPLMVKVFKTLPRIPYGVQSIPAAVAPDTTTAYYRQPAADGSRAGAYFVNLYRPEMRPKWGMMALSLHEAVPGHHFQIARAMELEELPAFRRYGGYTAYTEGWGLYSEHLGEELGLYKDPYDKFGQLTYEMWRSIRLVVDTGIHHKRWTRQQAIDYFLQNAPRTKLDVVNEVDRYIAWPGQALAYKIGELKIKELRKRSEDTLGEAFDLKEFHEVVLQQGAVPLDVLEQAVDDWLAAVSS